MKKTETKKDRQDPPSISMVKFFQETPPGSTVKVNNIAENRDPGILSASSSPLAIVSFNLILPDIELHCDNDSCKGKRAFRSKGKRPLIRRGEPITECVTFTCRNCDKHVKIFAIYAGLDNNSLNGEMLKIGELPPFGPPITSQLITLIRDDRELFFKGRRAESQGMGIGAFGYYRRVVENQKNRLLEEIIRVAEKTEASLVLIEELSLAKEEHQFTSAIESIKHGIPDILLIKGQNPLKLLHAALSEGLHGHTDEECLEIAQDIRNVLTELADRLAQVLKDDVELNKSVARLIQRKEKGKKNSE